MGTQEGHRGWEAWAFKQREETQLGWGSVRARKVEVSPVERWYILGGVRAPRVEKDEKMGDTSPTS